jgi:phosphoserine phosphatase RsbU/P
MIDFIMAAKRRTTIFRQLILNVMAPPIIALLLLGYLNYRHTRSILVEANYNQNYIIGDEIIKVLEFQDVALNLVERGIDQRMSLISNRICNKLSNIKYSDVEKIDLKQMQKELGMNPLMEDIYVIDRNGIVINTTFEKDLHLDFFSFGEKHKNMLMGIFDDGVFKDERFAIEASTKRLKKYSYQPTTDGSFIIELGFYSSEADEIIDFIKNTTVEIASKNDKKVELFIGADHPFSLNKNAVIEERHMSLLLKAFSERDTISVDETVSNTRLNYQFIYMDRKNTELYKGSVIQIVSDLTSDYKALKWELIKFLSIFGITLIIVTLLIYYKTRIITDPIKNLVVKVNRITHGHLEERADVIGNNEITTLSKQFNRMIEELESYYNELEQKVEERTREIQQQKEEIESQRDAIEDQRNMLSEKNDHLENAYKEIEAQKKNITDSIVYAKRIQNAILPPQVLIDEILPKSFILYKPKDIVSGDFYWIDKLQGKAIIAAVDCTGHGVPGAFMSIIGSNQLDYAVRVKKAKTANEILDHLNEGVGYSLRQESGQTRIRDGMDISLLVIDFKNNEVEYAGANNPLYHIRNGELMEYKADKFAIGTHIDYPEKKYTCNKIRVEKNDMLYIFSDGYADQFGGEKGRKYMYRQFKELLVKIAGKPLEEQRTLLDDENNNWRGEETQVDDIIIIGIRI